jgi:hypothetical protein
MKPEAPSEFGHESRIYDPLNRPDSLALGNPILDILTQVRLRLTELKVRIELD